MKPVCRSCTFDQTGAKNIPDLVCLACVNAVAVNIPQMVKVKGKTCKNLLAYNMEEGVPCTVYTYQGRAWIEDVLGEM